ncbi:hypothetical protein GCM10009741_31520 [Kribbella lupini]|uniref:DUF222 domain-containing protein n=1 Tax=Kribbella lupini TaxID=291602 RepID=A0ABN2AUA2_9ACTN
MLVTIADLAADGTDGGHLAGVVRDAIATSAVDLAKLSEALRPYAHRYGAPTGDGLALVQRLLDEAPLPPSTVQAAELMTVDRQSAASRKLAGVDPAPLRAISELTSDPETLRAIDAISSPQMRRDLDHLQEALATIRRATR